jgi:S1-C subfamily serine protease
MDRVWVHPAELHALRPTPPARGRRSRLAAFLVPIAAGAFGAIAAVVVLGIVGAFDRTSTDQSNQPVEQRVAARDAALTQFARAVAPGLVVVTVRDSKGTRQSSGVCVSHAGDVLTSAATIGTAKTATLTTTTGETVAAHVVGVDASSGLVLLQSRTPLRAVPLSDSMNRAGDSVWVFGATQPDASSPWVSSGVVSSIDALLANAPGPMTTGLLETDALGTEWTAGGALVDRTGGVAGIVLWPQGDHRGTYAVPIGRAESIVDALRAQGFVAHGSMPVLARNTATGPQIVEMPASGNAARGGLRSGDIITAIDGHPVFDVKMLDARVYGYAPGDVVEVELLRGSHPASYEVTLGSTPPG